MMNYSQKYIEHFSAPKNVGEIEQPDAVAEVEHTGGGCFDRIRVTVAVDDGKISEIRFKARACSGTIAAASAATEWAVGKSLEEAAGLGMEIVEEELGGVPEKKKHSVELAAEAVASVAQNAQKLND